MPGIILLLLFGGVGFVAIKLWQQHNRRAPIRELEERSEDLKDLSEMADLQDEVDDEAEALRERGLDIDDNTDSK